jgi:CubicO group peptidase (beta-lactamase class C family)
MKETLFKSLEMDQSTIRYPTEERKGKMTVPHDEKGQSKESGLHPVAFAHGGLLTTPMDLGKYVLELMNAYNVRTERVLSTHMIKKMLTSEASLNPTEFMGFTGQGLGIFLIEKEQETFFAHPGVNMPGATCHMIGCAEAGQGAVIMTNGINGFLLSLEILFSIAQEYEWKLW